MTHLKSIGKLSSLCLIFSLFWSLAVAPAAQFQYPIASPLHGGKAAFTSTTSVETIAVGYSDLLNFGRHTHRRRSSLKTSHSRALYGYLNLERDGRSYKLFAARLQAASADSAPPEHPPA